ncbi:hypothetical protein [Synechocystis sp. LKSZ1]|uniref:hypothetical protein n=1 Tax=Synechocystis sp. LKSZ1 TaxID=3144951 RepID=UPI00336BFB39
MDSENLDFLEDPFLDQEAVSAIDNYFDQLLTDYPTGIKPGEYNLEASMGKDNVPTIQLVNNILFKALQKEAQELRIIPLKREILIRANQGTGFYELLNTKLPVLLIESIVNIIRLNAGMEKLAKNKPVVGKMLLIHKDTVKEVVIRTLPGTHGTSLSLSFQNK